MLRKFYKQYFSILANDKICFFGSGVVAFPSAVKLHQNYNNVQFITHYTPEKQKMKNQVEMFCKQKNLTYLTPIKSKLDKVKRKQQWDAFINELKQTDFGVVVSFGYMIPQRVISAFKKGLIVVHPSLLPKYKGGAPIFHAIANGQQQTGVSYIEISPGKFDSGNILLQKKCQLNKKAKYSQIQASLGKFCAQNLLQVLNNIDQLRPGTPQQTLKLSQQQSYKQKAPIIKQKKLNLNQGAQKVYHMHRAMQNGRMKYGYKQIILGLQNVYLQDSEGKQVGTLKLKGKKLYVKCADKYIRIQNWRGVSQKAMPPGFFIEANLKKVQQKDWLKFQ